MIFRTFGWSFAVTILGLVAGFLYGGFSALAVVAILAVLEISLSFDNAVVNAKVLARMSPFWQKIFLTIGIAIAVFGMRLVFPILVVALTANMSPWGAVDMAFNDPDRYHSEMEYAYPMIAAFGGMFLMMLFLNWIFEDRDIHWLAWLEKPLVRIGKLDQLPVVIAGATLASVATWVSDDAHRPNVLVAGILGIVTYILVNGLGELFNQPELEEGEEKRRGPNDLVLATGKAGFFLFLYLEVLDASFSFDGVIGAFAISTDPIIIAIGLGIGAMYIRSMTVYLVRQGTLSEFRYLEHGAHWAIGALAVCMMISIGHHLSEWITGGVGAGLIITAFLSSVVLRNRNGRASDEPEQPELESSRI
ncbi:DUF475 domain-containing protein [Actinocorallia sp. API 0066]|uniref:DUF475 domain-containing protein n=1 Tax=Actinocorallia sp. API 0066 TaxID=2896846 RepID=UPI001E450809|nr:DUF475 domain-containing protein [Actinocorallia sp. API 0066]MCD0451093.1 DUF475 domain-containing protein [Actinocorallia sp. API 0066]